MTLVNGYATLLELKAPDRLNIAAADTISDSAIEAVITAISRAIDNECARYFYTSTTDETRYFTANNGAQLYTGDLSSITSLATDDLAGSRTYPYTWAATDYDLWPYSTSGNYQPYRFIDVAPRGNYLFPDGLAKGVKIVGKFGWASVPEPIHDACILWSLREFKRYKTPLGVSAMTALGEMQTKVPPPDNDVMFMISNFRMVAI